MNPMEDSKYKKWLQPTRDSNEFYCSFCRKTLSLRGKGVSALNEHMKTKLHTDNTKQSSNQTCLSIKKTSSDSSSSSDPVSLPLLYETRTELSSSSQPTSTRHACLHLFSLPTRHVNHLHHHHLSNLFPCQLHLFPVHRIVIAIIPRLLLNHFPRHVPLACQVHQRNHL